jgi:PAP2 superfamily
VSTVDAERTTAVDASADWTPRPTPTGPQVSHDDPARAPKSRERRLTVVRRVAIVTWVIVVVYRTWTTGFAFNREWLLIYICSGLVAASIGRRRVVGVIVDWLPFALVLVVYDFSRGAATLLGSTTLWQLQPSVDRRLFFGAEPTVWLQEHLKLAHPPWWEVITSLTYMSHFIVPYAVAGVLWLRNREDWKAFVRRFIALSFIAVTIYAVLPAAPPWAAARCTAADVAAGPSSPACMWRPALRLPDGGVLGAMSTHRAGAHDFVERISTRGWGTLHLDSARSLIDEGQASVNEVAAIPSLHAALTVLTCVFLWRRVQRRWRPVLAIYPLIMAFSLVYSAEHYVIDIMLGWMLAAIVLAVIGQLESRGPNMVLAVRRSFARGDQDRLTSRRFGPMQVADSAIE